MASPFELRWGIIATGGISTNFSKDLLVDPNTRDSGDIKHRIVAVGSRSVESAQAFIKKLQDLPETEAASWGVKQGLLDQAKGYASYEEVYNDPNVDAVYVGTPHNYHYQNAKGALLAGKNVLCEKPFTFDVEELDELIKLAKEKNVFLMEAVWTRFHPIAYEVEKYIHGGELGKVKRVWSDNSVNFNPDELDAGHRLINPDLAGGALLDLGPYPSLWVMLAMHRSPANKDRKAPKLVSSHQKVYGRTGVDVNARWRVEWEDVGIADLSCEFETVGLRNGTVAIFCEEGDLLVDWPPWQPDAFTIHPHPEKHGNKLGAVKEIKRVEVPRAPGGLMHYEADEVARCIRDGKKESERMPLSESRIVQSWFDEVRKNGQTVLRDVKGKAGQ